jgi:hypothetical protein
MLSPSDGAEFQAIVEQLPDGQWRASGVFRLDKKSEILEEPAGIEMFPTEGAAIQWVRRIGADHGFKSFKLETVRNPKSSK